MGCDIHLYKEKQVGGVWVSADEWKPDEHEAGLVAREYIEELMQ